MNRHGLSNMQFAYHAKFLTNKKAQRKNFKKTAAIQFNKICKTEPLTPKYLQGKVKGKRLAII